MIQIFRACVPGWDLHDLHDLHMFADCDLCDLRDLDNVSWARSARSSSYTHAFLGICMIQIFRACVPGWDLNDVHDPHMFTDCDL